MAIKVNGNDIEKALKLFKREVQKDGLLRELKKRRFYEKPSIKTKTKQREALKRRQKSIKLKRQEKPVS